MNFLRWPARKLSQFSNFCAQPWAYQGKYVVFKTLHIVNFVCAIHLFTDYIGRPSLMDGPSMLPTLAHTGEVVIEDRLTYRLFPDKLARGDLVLLKSPLDPARIICKRLIGLPGDVICADPTGRIMPSSQHVIVPKGHIWISGDNLAESRDSREYGPASMALIEGRLLMRLWPPSQFTFFRNPSTIID